MTLPWLRFEPPSVRQARLRATTMRLSGEVLDLTEQRENLQFRPSPSPSGVFADRFGEAEQFQSQRQFRARSDEPVPGTVPQPAVGIEGLTSQEQQKAFEGQDLPNLDVPMRRAQFAWLRRAGVLSQEGLSVDEALSTAEAEIGPLLETILTPEQRGGLAGRFERGLPRVVGGIGKGIEAVDEAAFQANAFINEQLGTPPEQQPPREDFSVLGGRLTEGQTETLRTILPKPLEDPVIREAEFFSSPAGLASSLAFPGFVAKGAVGGVGLAGAGNVAGVPEEVEIGLQIAGNIFAPGAGVVPNLSRLVGGLKGVKATAYVTAITEKITIARQASAANLRAGNAEAARLLENEALVLEGALARAEGRALVSEATGDVIGAGVTATRADIVALKAVRAETIGDITAPEFVQAAVKADVRARRSPPRCYNPARRPGQRFYRHNYPKGYRM